MAACMWNVQRYINASISFQKLLSFLSLMDVLMHLSFQAYIVLGSTKTQQERESNLNRKDGQWVRENSIGSTLQAVNMGRKF